MNLFRVTIPHLGARLSVLLLAICAIGWSSTMAEQASHPANTFLDVQVPASPMALRVGGRPQLVYELHITNFRSAVVTLSRVEVQSNPAGKALHSYESNELISALSRVGARHDNSDPRVISGGQRVILFVWFPVDGDVLPTSLRHKIFFLVNNKELGSVEVGPLSVQNRAPLVLSPPLRGGPWVAVYDPRLKNGHRRVVFAIDGRARIPARFAIDWIKLGPEGLPAHDDGAVMSNSYGYGEEALAVADAVVTSAVDEFPEPTPDISLTNEAGNYVTLDLGGGRFAFYEHLKPGSVRVKVGERVRRGQVIATLGASGSVSSGAHLHFHVAESNSTHAAEGIPFVLDDFERIGSLSSVEDLGRAWVPASGENSTRITLEMPAMLSVVRFKSQGK
jgi:peptidase M23-like protein